MTARPAPRRTNDVAHDDDHDEDRAARERALRRVGDGEPPPEVLAVLRARLDGLERNGGLTTDEVRARLAEWKRKTSERD